MLLARYAANLSPPPGRSFAIRELSGSLQFVHTQRLLAR